MHGTFEHNIFKKGNWSIFKSGDKNKLVLVGPIQNLFSLPINFDFPLFPDRPRFEIC